MCFTLGFIYFPKESLTAYYFFKHTLPSSSHVMPYYFIYVKDNKVANTHVHLRTHKYTFISKYTSAHIYKQAHTHIHSSAKRQLSWNAETIIETIGRVKSYHWRDRKVQKKIILKHKQDEIFIEISVSTKYFTYKNHKFVKYRTESMRVIILVIPRFNGIFFHTRGLIRKIASQIYIAHLRIIWL